MLAVYRRFSGGSDIWQRICLQCRRPGFKPWVRKMPWRREWQPTPVFLPRESHEQMSLSGYSPWGHKESHMTKQQTLSLILSEIYGKNYPTIVPAVKDKEKEHWTNDDKSA